MRPERKLKPIQCACTNLKMASRQVGRAYDEALAPTGLNVTQYAILVNIERYAPISQMDLADHLKLERTSLYRAVGLMKKKGWLKLTPVGAGVTVELSLTPAGARVLKPAKAVWSGVHAKFLEAFGEKRWEELLATLNELNEHFAP